MLKKVDKNYSKWVVEYGVAFYHDSKYFDTKIEAIRFINSHVFENPEYFSFYEKRYHPVEFVFERFPNAKTREVENELFEHGIVSREDWIKDQLGDC